MTECLNNGLTCSHQQGFNLNVLQKTHSFSFPQWMHRRKRFWKKPVITTEAQIILQGFEKWNPDSFALQLWKSWSSLLPTWQMQDKPSSLRESLLCKETPGLDNLVVLLQTGCKSIRNHLTPRQELKIWHSSEKTNVSDHWKEILPRT